IGQVLSPFIQFRNCQDFAKRQRLFETSGAARSRTRFDGIQGPRRVGMLNANAAFDCAGVKAGGEIDGRATSLFKLSKYAQLQTELQNRKRAKEGVPSLTKYRNGVRFHDKMCSVLRACRVIGTTTAMEKIRSVSDPGENRHRRARERCPPCP